MKKLYVKVLIILLIVIESFTLFLAYKSLDDKVEKQITNEITNTQTFAILIEQEDGSFKEGTAWPTDGYIYSASLSGCVDHNGNKLGDILSYNPETKVASVSTKTTAICYLYFEYWGDAYALYSESDQSLTFVRSKNEIKANDIYNGKVVTASYTGFEDVEYSSYSSIPWASYRSNIVTIDATEKIKPVSMAYWFYGFVKAENVKLEKIDTSYVTSLKYTFYNFATNTASLILDLNNWDTSNVTNMTSTFESAGSHVYELDINISKWNTKKVTNMSRTFIGSGLNSTIFNIDVSNWDTSNVTDMSAMFNGTGQNKATIWSIGDLSDWDVSKVINMGSMFAYAGKCEDDWKIGDLSNWNTKSLKYTSYMFIEAGHKAIKWDIGDLSSWDTSNIVQMQYMFARAGYLSNNFNLTGLENWNTKNVSNMNATFINTGFNANYLIDLREWDISSVTNYDDFNINVETKVLSPFPSIAYAIYTSCNSKLTFVKSQNPYYVNSTFDNCSITSVYTGFEEKSYQYYEVPWYNIRENVTSIVFRDEINPVSTSYWFYQFSKAYSFDVSKLNTSKVTDMSYMFSGVGTNNLTIVGLNGWNTSNVTNMAFMFEYAGLNATTWNIGDISKWNTSNVRDMQGMFYNAGTKTTTWSIGDISKWNTSNVTNMIDMFWQVGLSANYTLDLTSWNVSKVTNYSNFNYNVEDKILAPFVFTTAYAVYTASDSTLTFIRRVCTVNAGSTYNGKTITAVYTGFENTAAVENSSYSSQQFRDANVAPWYEYRSAITKVVFADEIRPVSTAAWFNGFTNMTSIDLSKLNTMNTTSMSHMFFECRSLTSLSLNHLDVSKVKAIDRMFRYCSGITSLDLSNWKTNSLTNMNTMFMDMTSLKTINLTGWDTSKVTNMSYAFSKCSNLTTINGITNWNVTSLKDSSRMFYQNTSLTALNLSGWTTSNLTDTTNMFYECTNLSSLNLNNFNTTNVTSMHGMFFHCSSLVSLNLNSFNTSNVTRMGNMFTGCSNLQSIYMNNFNTSKVVDMENMFSQCSKLTLNASNWNVSNVLYACNFKDNATGVIAPSWANNAGKVCNN